MRWNPWARVGLATLAQVTVGVMLASGEWATEAVPSPPVVTAAAPSAVAPQARPTAEHVRQLQQALATAGFDPGPVDGIFGPRTKSALRKYIAVPPPQVPSAADQAIARFRTNELREGP
jgi:putative peptidoglycan binding protein